MGKEVTEGMRKERKKRFDRRGGPRVSCRKGEGGPVYVKEKKWKRRKGKGVYKKEREMKHRCISRKREDTCAGVRGTST